MIRRNSPRPLLALLAALSQPLVGHAQPTVLPGSQGLVTARLPGTSGRFRIVGIKPGDTTQTEIATVHYERRLVAHVVERRNEPGVLLILTGVAAGKTLVDSSLFLLRSLAPVWEVARSGEPIERFAYEGSHVTATRTTPDSGERHFDATYAMPFFTFSLRSELIEALPLGPGYRAILPIYSEGDHALEMDTVQVVGGDAAHEWKVRYADPVVVATFAVDARTRAITGYSHTFRNNGYTMRWVISRPAA